jgi:hypothetical protein
VVEPPVEIVTGITGTTFTVVLALVVPHVAVATTEYVFAVFTTIEVVTSPVDQRYEPEPLAVKVKSEPAQTVAVPPGLIETGVSLMTVTFIVATSLPQVLVPVTV